MEDDREEAKRRRGHRKSMYKCVDLHKSTRDNKTMRRRRLIKIETLFFLLGRWSFFYSVGYLWGVLRSY